MRLRVVLGFLGFRAKNGVVIFFAFNEFPGFVHQGGFLFSILGGDRVGTEIWLAGRHEIVAGPLSQSQYREAVRPLGGRPKSILLKDKGQIFRRP